MPHQPVNHPLPWILGFARVHEAQGRGAVAFACYQALHHQGAVFWISGRHDEGQLLPAALPSALHERLHFIEAPSQEELLWATEETLRAAPTGLVIAQSQQPLSLTTGRRLQLAAAAGQTTGLMLIRDHHGSNAAQTRWQCEPLAGQSGSTLQRWQLIKNKSGTLGEWAVHWDGKASACHMVSEAGK